MAIVIQKYGGSLLANPQKILDVAKKIQNDVSSGNKVIAIVSAMGKTTDELLDLAHQVSDKPIRRELDMLLSVGERISMALLSMALNDLGISARSFTGSQSGILTESDHTQARILEIKPTRIESDLQKRDVLIIAGFQGVSPNEKEITTLGRGGTDTTAVAMAWALKAESCEIIKEVGGVYSSDPLFIPDSHYYPEMDFSSLLEATYWGAKILHFRAVELAQKLNMSLKIKHFDNKSISTLIHGERKMLEEKKVITISSHKKIYISSFDRCIKDTLKNLEALLKKHSLPWPQILGTELTEVNGKSKTKLFLASSDESMKVLLSYLQEEDFYIGSSSDFSTVTATGYGCTGTDLSLQIIKLLDEDKIKVEKIFFTPQSISVLVQSKDLEKTTKLLHSLV